MLKKDETRSCCAPNNRGSGKVESVISVEGRGQTVLPKKSKDILDK